jgi:hypothetical protein
MVAPTRASAGAARGCEPSRAAPQKAQKTAPPGDSRWHSRQVAMDAARVARPRRRLHAGIECSRPAAPEDALQPLVVAVEDTASRAVTRHAFRRSPVRVGRAATSDLPLPFPFASLRHGLLQFDEREVRYTDLGSSNGSVLDGVALDGGATALLAPGAELRIGRLRLTFARGPAAEEPAATPVAPGAVTALLERLARTPEFEAGAAWASSLRPGLAIGRFELVRELGRGGFGVVWEALDRQLGRRVAFKALNPGGPADGALLHREAEAAAQLGHPNIVALHDVGSWEGGPFLILELLRGETLAQRLLRGPLPLDEALRVAIEVARALAHAHAAGVVHRDLKPGNVFLCEDGFAKVLDLGLAHVFGRDPAVAGGTPRYMAPEQVRREPPDGRADVYAAAAVLRESLGEPLPGPASLGYLLARASAEDPAARPADGREWREALLAVQRDAERGEPEPASPHAPVTAPGRPGLRMLLAAAALALLSAGMALFLRSRS